MCPQPIQTTTPETDKNASTGPRTPEGKAVSSQNALRHGLASSTMVIASESSAEWEEFRDGMFAEWQPTTPTEEALVGDMAKHQWLKDRAIRFQHDCMQYSGLDQNRTQYFAVLLRYQTTNERAFARAKKQLEEMRREALPKTRQPEFVSQNENAAPDPLAASPSKRRKREIAAECNDMSDAQVEREIDEMIAAFGLGAVPLPVLTVPKS